MQYGIWIVKGNLRERWAYSLVGELFPQVLHFTLQEDYATPLLFGFLLQCSKLCKNVLQHRVHRHGWERKEERKKRKNEKKKKILTVTCKK